MSNPPAVQVLILAAGKSERFGDLNTCKITSQLGKQAVFAYSVDRFLSWSKTRSLSIVVSSQNMPIIHSYLTEKMTSHAHALTLRANCVIGGNSRHQSFLNGCSTLQTSHSQDLIFVHDGARPMLSVDMLNMLYRSAQESQADLITLCKPMINTVAQLKTKTTTNEIENIVAKRERYVQVETPQMIRLHALLSIISNQTKIKTDAVDFPDLISWGLKHGLTAEAVFWHDYNLKITNTMDIQIAHKLLEKNEDNHIQS